MAAVQFCGRENIVTAYGERGGDEAWGLCSGKDLLRAGADGVSLDAFLKSLEHSGSAATYGLRFYRGEEVDEIDRDTPYHSCYYVKLTEALYQSAGAGRVGTMDPVSAELHGYISKKVLAGIKKEMEGDDDEPEETVGDLLKGLLRNPDKLIGVIGAVKSMFGGVPVGMPMAMAGGPAPQRAVGTVKSPTGKPGPEELMQRIAAAIDRLEKCDPDILVHLEKLAALAETNPAMYSMAVKMLG